MVSAKLQYLEDCILLEKLFEDDHLSSFAQEGGVAASIEGGIKEYAKSLWNPETPYASIMAIFGGGLIASLGFPWIAGMYEVAQALGFDWSGFWGEVGHAIVSFLQEFAPGVKSSLEEATSKINDIVGSAVQSNFSGSVDYDKLGDLAAAGKVSLNSRLEDLLEIKRIGMRIGNKKDLEKYASIFNIKGLVAKLFKWLIIKLIKTVLISCGFIAVTGAIGGLTGTHPGPESDSSEESKDSEPTSFSEIKKMKVSPSVNQDLFTFHNNDINSVWIERGNINQIEDEMMYWIINAYPNLQQSENSIRESSAFNLVLSRFKQRNQMAEGTGLISIPKPFQRKIDVVTYIVSQYLNTVKHPLV